MNCDQICTDNSIQTKKQSVELTKNSKFQRSIFTQIISLKVQHDTQ